MRRRLHRLGCGVHHRARRIACSEANIRLGTLGFIVDLYKLLLSGVQIFFTNDLYAERN
jgi:hypothetical protein